MFVQFYPHLFHFEFFYRSISLSFPLCLYAEFRNILVLAQLISDFRSFFLSFFKSPILLRQHKKWWHNLFILLFIVMVSCFRFESYIHCDDIRTFHSILLVKFRSAVFGDRDKYFTSHTNTHKNRVDRDKLIQKLNKWRNIRHLFDTLSQFFSAATRPTKKTHRRNPVGEKCWRFNKTFDILQWQQKKYI